MCKKKDNASSHSIWICKSQCNKLLFISDIVPVYVHLYIGQLRVRFFKRITQYGVFQHSYSRLSNIIFKWISSPHIFFLICLLTKLNVWVSFICWFKSKDMELPSMRQQINNTIKQEYTWRSKYGVQQKTCVDKQNLYVSKCVQYIHYLCQGVLENMNNIYCYYT